MKKLIPIILLILSISTVKSQDIPVWKLADLKNEYHLDSTTTYIFNFWATWCAPCIRELPIFETLNQESAIHHIKVTLVSLDFVESLSNRVSPFVLKKKLTTQVVLLDETNYNVFIPKISEAWTGSIPATLAVNLSKGIYEFKEGEFKTGQLNKWLEMIGAL